MNYRDFCTGVLFFLLGIGTVWYGKDFYDDSAYIPVSVGVLMSLFALGLMLRSLMNSQLIQMRLMDHPAKFIATLTSCIGYFVLLPLAGFYTSSTLFIVTLSLLIGERRPVVILSITLVFITALYLLFALVLKRSLPVEFFLAV
ncbi:MAG: tripartite tricarboxylate transporter TctB family protein [Nitrincola lacisaponensis]|uniref:tripartite tricarboxylate transporter TctB family protein n=1 Tax=Nitrincola lacisaponensis TaxID=267850 RepID=UPI00391C85CB